MRVAAITGSAAITGQRSDHPRVLRFALNSAASCLRRRTMSNTSSDDDDARCAPATRGTPAPSSANSSESRGSVNTGDAELPAACLAIARRLALLSPKAIEAFDLIVGRFELGQVLYGAPSADRNWKLDTLEELLDLCVYRGLTLACAGPQLPTPIYSCTFPTDPTQPVDPVERGLAELRDAPVTARRGFDFTDADEPTCVCQAIGCTGCAPGGFGVAG